MRCAVPILTGTVIVVVDDVEDGTLVLVLVVVLRGCSESLRS